VNISIGDFHAQLLSIMIL